MLIHLMCILWGVKYGVYFDSDSQQAAGRPDRPHGSRNKMSGREDDDDDDKLPGGRAKVKRRRVSIICVLNVKNFWATFNEERVCSSIFSCRQTSLCFCSTSALYHLTNTVGVVFCENWSLVWVSSESDGLLYVLVVENPDHRLFKDLNILPSGQIQVSENLLQKKQYPQTQ